jgi:hypothetical protein
VVLLLLVVVDGLDGAGHRRGGGVGGVVLHGRRVVCVCVCVQWVVRGGGRGHPSLSLRRVQCPGWSGGAEEARTSGEEWELPLSIGSSSGTMTLKGFTRWHWDWGGGQCKRASDSVSLCGRVLVASRVVLVHNGGMCCRQPTVQCAEEGKVTHLNVGHNTGG